MMDSLLFLGGACLLSFGISAFFAGKVQLRRNIYLLAYIPIIGVYVTWFFARTEPELSALLAANWHWGLVGAALAGTAVIRNVLSQPPYPRHRGGQFVLDVVWPGLAYGITDALLLSVVPVVAVQAAFRGAAWTGCALGTAAVGALALAASLIVTFCYHVGYPEFRNRRVLWTMYGNGVMTLGFLITGSPLAAIIPHAAMHVAVMWHGRESTGQLPPHYQTH